MFQRFNELGVTKCLYADWVLLRKTPPQRSVICAQRAFMLHQQPTLVCYKVGGCTVVVYWDLHYRYLSCEFYLYSWQQHMCLFFVYNIVYWACPPFPNVITILWILPPVISIYPSVWPNCSVWCGVENKAFRGRSDMNQSVVCQAMSSIVKHCEQADYHPAMQRHFERAEALEVLKCT